MIYPALLKEDFAKLPPVLRAFHSAPGRRCAAGTMSIRRESAWLAWLIGFPPAGEQVPVKLEVDATDGGETWTRRFGDVVRRSTQRVESGVLIEEAGPVRIAFRIRAGAFGMIFESQRVRVWGIPVPLRIEAFVKDGELSWEVEVRIAHVGFYSGVMTLES